jgi:hypothetical protein
MELFVDTLHWKLEHRMQPGMNFVMKIREQRENMAAC